MLKDDEKRIQALDNRITSMEKTAMNYRHELRREIQKWMLSVNEKVAEFHDYLTRQKGYELGVKDAQIKKDIRSGDVVISKQAWWLIVKFVGIMGSVIGIVMVLLGVNGGS